jgi:hypothetical protein
LLLLWAQLVERGLGGWVLSQTVISCLVCLDGRGLS